MFSSTIQCFFPKSIALIPPTTNVFKRSSSPLPARPFKCVKNIVDIVDIVDRIEIENIIDINLIDVADIIDIVRLYKMITPRKQNSYYFNAPSFSYFKTFLFNLQTFVA